MSGEKPVKEIEGIVYQPSQHRCGLLPLAQISNIQFKGNHNMLVHPSYLLIPLVTAMVIENSRVLFCFPGTQAYLTAMSVGSEDATPKIAYTASTSFSRAVIVIQGWM